MKYQLDTFLYRLDETTSIFALKFAINSSDYVDTHSPPSIATIVGIPMYISPNIYTVAFKDGSLLEDTKDLLSTALEHNPTKPSLSLPTWIKGGANGTLFLNDMSKPRHGTL